VKKKLYFIVLMLLLISCAAIGPATGGPEDKQGPFLIYSTPYLGAINIPPSKQVQITFSEPIDPNSIHASIRIIPETEFKTMVRKNILTIIPKNNWNKDLATRIIINRNVRDFQNNIMDSPINIIFSTSNTIGKGVISGKLINTEINQIYEIGLFEYPPQDTLTPILKTQSNHDGEFIFNFLNMKKYFIIVSSEEIVNISEEIKYSNYGLLPFDYLEIGDNIDSIKTKIYIDNPLPKLEIQSAQLLGKQYGKLIYTNGIENLFYFSLNDKFTYPKNLVISNWGLDSIKIISQLENRFNQYFTPPLYISNLTLIDTIAPILDNHSTSNNQIIFEFNEPISFNQLKDNSMNAYFLNSDSNQIEINLKSISPFSIETSILPDEVEKIYFNKNIIIDFENIGYPDSITSFSFHKTNEIINEIKINYGQLSGEIINIEYDVMIEAKNISEKTVNYTKTINNKFQFLELIPGAYNLRAFEILNNMNDSIYFSGTVIPYKRAGKFTIYPHKIDIRGRWEIKGIKIRF
jgi:hypothetical protein